MKYEILEKINSPDDLKRVEKKELPRLCDEIRAFLVENVEKQGGHLASNLGVVELSVAIHRVFDSPSDHVIFDVGHQSYVHKILTGRRDKFDTLRKTGGLSGFTSMRESEYDAFGAGHSSTSVSAALGYAEADKLNKKDVHTVAVIGDGAYTGGMVHEALNNCDPSLKFVMILNENGMSISTNQGRFASYLSRVRYSKGYIRWKKGTKSFLSHLPLVGKPLTSVFSFVKDKFKKLFYSPNYFEELGLHYIGPIDGNDYFKVERALYEAKKLNKCVVLHVKTVKGKGYEPAEKSPDEFHSVYTSPVKSRNFHSVFAEHLIKMAEGDKDIVAVTAAMGKGTGLDEFGAVYPKRYFDVGIAEEHALTFSAGLAAGGLKPYAAVYSTFLQRAYDNIIHDVCLQKLPVKIVIDRAGVALSDGATHHGIFDVSFLSHIPEMTIYAPITYGSLRAVLDKAHNINSPVALRYSNSSENPEVVAAFYPDGNYSDFGVRADFDKSDAPEYVFITYGRIVDKVLSAKQLLWERGIDSGIILLERLKPYDDIADEVLEYVSEAKSVLFAEEGIKNGGAGMLLSEALAKNGFDVFSKYQVAAIDDNFALPSEVCDIYDYLGLSAEALAKKILSVPLEKNVGK